MQAPRPRFVQSIFFQIVPRSVHWAGLAIKCLDLAEEAGGKGEGWGREEALENDALERRRRGLEGQLMQRIKEFGRSQPDLSTEGTLFTLTELARNGGTSRKGPRGDS